MNDNLTFYESRKEHRNVTIIGVPLELGSDERGFSEAPTYVLKEGLEKVITDAGGENIEIQTVPCRTPERVVSAGNTKYLDEIVATAKVSKVLVEKAIKRDDFVVAIGGDHSMAVGTIAGAAAALHGKRVGVIWIDAHPDANTDETTQSGNIHGMPAASRMGFGHPLLTGIDSNVPNILPENFLYLGLKDIDTAEIEFIRKHSIKTITMMDIEECGLSRATLAIDALRRKTGVIWVSMDMDSIDREYAPGVGMPTDGGFSRREILNLARYIGKTCTLAGLDIVEIVPKKDVERKTVTLALDLVAQFMGSERGWYQHYMDQYRETNVTKRELEEKKEIAYANKRKNRNA
ncbi:arginase [Candidatus Parcubacteria bacterium]|nr:MAG: arginase [Candidatus Parcubacteria bacterium]